MFSIGLKETADIIVACTATVGAVLGIYNSYELRQSKKVFLTLVPSLSLPQSNGSFLTIRSSSLSSLSADDLYAFRASSCLSLRIINKSLFPVEIADAGFSNGKSLKRRRCSIPEWFLGNAPSGLEPHPNGLITFPFKLSSRQAALLIARKGIEDEVIQTPCSYAYVQTSCEESSYAKANLLIAFLAR